MPKTISRECFRLYVMQAHIAAGNAQIMMMEGIATNTGVPVIEDRMINEAISHLEKASHQLRVALARVEDPEEGESQ